jgi:hypothetical protein
MQLPIDFQAAERRADTGMRRAADRACRVVDPLWVETAIGFLAEHARTAGEFTIEQARIALAGKVAQAPDGRAWGHVTRIAIQRGLIVRVGMARAASSNGSFKATYQAGRGAA